MLSSLWLDATRWWWMRKDVREPLRTVLHTGPPRARRPIANTKIVAVDLELTGLAPRADQIVAIGWVVIEQGRIQMQSARRTLVQIDGSVSDSATVHGIVDASLQDAVPLADALSPLLQEMNRAVLLAHHAPVEQHFLNAACRACFGAPLLVPVIDTVALGRRLLERGTRSASDDALRLPALRQRYRLPASPAHDALTDALATAELFLAQCTRLGDISDMPLSVVWS
jgi:DNA polymerase-3 subunit epsilon